MSCAPPMARAGRGRGRTAARVLRHALPPDRADDRRPSVVRLVDELRWLNTIVLHSEPPGRRGAPNQPPARSAAPPPRCWRSGADLLERPGADSDQLHAALEPRCVADSPRWRWRPPRGCPSSPAGGRRAPDSQRARDFVSALDPSFRAQELSFVVSQVARNIDLAAAAERRSWLERLLGRQPEGLRGPLAAARSAPAPTSSATRCGCDNSVRGAAALGLGGAGGRSDRGAARLLGRARHPVGAALKRPEHRPERGARRCSARPPGSSSAARWWR